MKFLLEHTLRDYVALGDDTTRKLLDSGTPPVAAVEEYYRFFQTDLWTADDMKMSAHQALLSMHSFMTWTAAVRMALSGYAAATFPLFRTALEAACYAYLMKNNEDLEKVWLDRHTSPEALKKSRKAFTSAVKEAAAQIDAGKSPPRFEKWVMDAYDGAIDHGAHPNPKSIFRHINPPEDAGDYVIVALTGVYDAENAETQRMLVACLDYGLVIACVLAHGLKEVPDDLSANLDQLNQLKERLSGELLNHLRQKTRRARKPFPPFGSFHRAKWIRDCRRCWRLTRVKSWTVRGSTRGGGRCLAPRAHEIHGFLASPVHLHQHQHQELRRRARSN